MELFADFVINCCRHKTHLGEGVRNGVRTCHKTRLTMSCFYYMNVNNTARGHCGTLRGHDEGEEHDVLFRNVMIEKNAHGHHGGSTCRHGRVQQQHVHVPDVARKSQVVQLQEAETK